MAQQDPAQRGYNVSVQVKIGKTTITKHIDSVRIINSTSSIWPQIAITCTIDNLDMIYNDIYGQDSLNLKIIAFGEDPAATKGKRIDLDLMILQSNIGLPMRRSFSGQERTEGIYQKTHFVCVPAICVRRMSAFSNYIHTEEDGDIDSITLLKKILDSSGIHDYKVSESFKNKETISQIVIPPMCIRDVIDYINRFYPLYSGPSFRFCSIDGMLDIHCLTNKMSGEPDLTVVQLSGVNSPTEEVKKIFKDEINPTKIHITNNIVETSYFPNANLMKSSSTPVFIQHPSDNLYNISTGNSIEVGESNGLIDKNKNIKTHKDLETSKTYHTDPSGMDNDSYMISRLSSSMARSINIKFDLDRNILFDNVVYVGKSLKFLPMDIDYQSYSGRYIVDATDYLIDRTKSNNWTVRCGITATRTCLNSKNIGI